MRGSLSVRVSDGFTDRIVTRHVKDLRFRKTAPGGHHSASCTLTLPRDTFTDLGPADKFRVYDARTGKCHYAGNTENPGVKDGPAGQSFELSSIGGMALAQDESHKLIYLDRALDSWAQDTIETVYMPPSATASQSTDPNVADRDVLMCQFTPGSPIDSTTRNRTAVSYLGFVGIDMEIGAFSYSWRAGKTDANYQVESYVGVHPTFSVITDNPSASTAGGSATEYVVTGFTGGKNILGLRLRRVAGGATNIADEDTYAVFYNVSILGRRMTRYGVLVDGSAGSGGAPGMGSVTSVKAHEVVEDLLGRVLSMCDPASAVIDETTHEIDQLAYPEGAKGAQVLDDLMLYEPDHYWGIGAPGPNGLHEFWYRAWPTTPRYEISVKDGYNAPGGEVDLCNRIAVYWTDGMDRKRQTTVTQTVPELGTRTRDADPVTLPDGLGSEANALRVGQQVLAGKAHPPRAATATVRRPIMDHLTGQMVMPWEIEPGYLVRVRETGDDLRMTEMEYVDTDCAATLTLGDPVRSTEQIIAALSRKA